MNNTKSCHTQAAQRSAIREIIDGRKLVAHFQQIISVSRKKVSGIEGLIRGLNADTNEIIPPNQLFYDARNEHVTMELDRACREKVLEAFSQVHQDDREKLLFLNVDASILDAVVGSDYLLSQVQKYRINPNNIVIEISEKSVQGNASLKKFSDTYKKYGFMIALDDVGTGFSNMDRILLVKPDIIKIDGSLVRNINMDFYKQGVFRSLVSLSNKIGALVIAEGVETEEEAIQVLRLGGHMIQGYFFSVPAEIVESKSVYANGKIEQLSKRFNEYMQLQFVEERKKNQRLFAAVRCSVKRFKTVPELEFDRVLTEIVSGNDVMECAYILDDNGLQISDTVCTRENNASQKNLIFYSACKGTDHSMEKYYYPLISSKTKKYTTEPYVSLATGSLCVTMSVLFSSIDHKKYILCIDFKMSDDALKIELKTPIISINAGVKSEMVNIINKMNEEIIKDSLTGSFNRRYIEERLLVDIVNAANDNQPLSIILADVDRFKDVNDKFGHLAGDRVLKDFVRQAKNFVRKNDDWVARYGGDEFLIVLNNADESAAQRAAEKIRLAVEQTPVSYGQARISYTVSFGTFTVRSEKTTCDELIEQADRNLYNAKNAGKNKTFGGSGLKRGGTVIVN